MHRTITKYTDIYAKDKHAKKWVRFFLYKFEFVHCLKKYISIIIVFCISLEITDENMWLKFGSDPIQLVIENCKSPSSESNLRKIVSKENNKISE